MSSLKRTTGEANISPEKRQQQRVRDEDELVISCSDSSSTSSSTDTENIETKDHVRRDIRGIPFMAKMLNLFREFVVFCLVMVTLSALTKDPPKVTKPPAAYPFFPSGSVVTDWYRGQISRAIESTRSNDVAFIMFYAPWDADSQAARQEFEHVAAYMHETVSFAAVNCWQPQGECRIQYPKVYKWPVLIAYPSHGRGVQYNGPISAPHILGFLKRVCYPIIRMDEGDMDIFDDVFVVAELNTSPGSLDFAVLYTVSLNYLERDPQQRIKFYLKPSSINKPVLDLHLWNETLRYPTHEKNWTAEEMMQWILKNINQVTSWVTPSGTKSQVLSAHLQNSPALILFTPNNPLRSTDYYDMLQEIGLDYNNCDDENIVVKMNALSVKLKRAENRDNYNKMKTLCRVRVGTENKKIITDARPVWANSSTCFNDGERRNCDLRLKEKVNVCSNTERNVPLGSKTYGNVDERRCGIPENYISMLTGHNDARSPKNLLIRLKSEKCKQFVLAEKVAPAIFEAADETSAINITGLRCKNNNTLSLLAMDSLVHHKFAERLGIDLTKRHDKSAVIIVDDAMETHYIMDNKINTNTVKQFISNFAKNYLNRSLASLVTLNVTDKGNHLTKHGAVKNTDVVVRELETSSFLQTVSQRNLAVLVFYYSKQCSFCSGIAFNFLTVAKKLSKVENLLFTRIDGEMNSLPWEYTMETYPTILLFPANSKSESRVFPSNVPITVPNLIGFILANIDPSLKLNVMWSICNQTKLSDERVACNMSLLGETLSVIDRTLQEWRRSNKRQRQSLLHSLRELQQLHLLFAHSSHKHQLIRNHFKRLYAKLGPSEDYRSVEEATTRRTRHKDEL